MNCRHSKRASCRPSIPSSRRAHWWLRPLPCRQQRRALRCLSSVRPGTATPRPEAAAAPPRRRVRAAPAGEREREKHPEIRNHRRTSAGIRLAQVQPPTRPPHVKPAYLYPRYCPRTITQRDNIGRITAKPPFKSRQAISRPAVAGLRRPTNSLACAFTRTRARPGGRPGAMLRVPRPSAGRRHRPGCGPSPP